MLSLHSSDSAVSSSSNDLTQGLHTDIASSEDAGDVGVHVVISLDIAVLGINDALEQRVVYAPYPSVPSFIG